MLPYILPNVKTVFVKVHNIICDLHGFPETKTAAGCTCAKYHAQLNGSLFFCFIFSIRLSRDGVFFHAIPL